MKNVNDVILHHVLTEKSTDLLAAKKYTFVVRPDATKGDVSGAVESLFSVKVAQVWTLPMRTHRKGGNRTPGFTSRRKKAIVTLQGDQKIAALEVKG